MKLPSQSQILIISCALALVALGLIVWSLFDPRPIPVIAAISAGQVIGTLSFGAFLLVVVMDWRKHYRRVSSKSSLP